MVRGCYERRQQEETEPPSMRGHACSGVKALAKASSVGLGSNDID